MSRRMYDGINVLSVPDGADLYAGYDDGQWPDAMALATAHPGKTVVRITTDPADNEGTVIDVEKGDANPQTAVDWVVNARARGVDPTEYCEASQWFDCRNAFGVRKIAQPHYWVADFDGDPTIPDGAIAKQFQNHPGYDESIVADYWPGVDSPTPGPAPKPVPIQQPTKEEEMQAIIVNGLLTCLAAGQDGHLLQFTREADGWHVDDVTDEIKAKNPTDPKEYVVSP
jgi:hypothetical protein